MPLLTLHLELRLCRLQDARRLQRRRGRQPARRLRRASVRGGASRAPPQWAIRPKGPIPRRRSPRPWWFQPRSRQLRRQRTAWRPSRRSIAECAARQERADPRIEEMRLVCVCRAEGRFSSCASSQPLVLLFSHARILLCATWHCFLGSAAHLSSLLLLRNFSFPPFPDERHVLLYSMHCAFLLLFHPHSENGRDGKLGWREKLVCLHSVAFPTLFFLGFRVAVGMAFTARCCGSVSAMNRFSCALTWLAVLLVRLELGWVWILTCFSDCERGCAR